MAGPAAAILTPTKIGATDLERIRSTIRGRAACVEGDDFWLVERPFLVTFGPEYLVPRPTSAFRIGSAPVGARALPILGMHQSGLGTSSVPGVQQPGTMFRAVVLGELDEFAALGVASVLGWSPQGSVGFAAMCNEPQDHRLLGELCLEIATLLNGMVNFDGMIRPFPRLDGNNEAAPVRVENPEGMRGTLVGVAYMTGSGTYATQHVGDAQFLRSWLLHPEFHMVK